MPVSPGIYVREYDFSQYVAQLGVTNPAILGGATQGPIGIPTAIGSEGALINIFGKPSTSDYGLQCAVRYLKKGGRLTYVRVAHSAVKAAAAVSGHVLTSVGTRATGTVTFSSTGPVAHELVTIYQTNPSLTLTAITVGETGNNILLSTTSAGITVSGPALTGGVGSTPAVGTVIFIANPTTTQTITIGTQAFQFLTTPLVSTDVQRHATDRNITAANLVAAVAAWNLANPTLAVAVLANVTKSAVFEFIASGGSVNTVGNIPVVIYPGVISSTAQAFATAVGQSIIQATVVVTPGASPLVTLTNALVGTLGNGSIVEAATNVVATGFTGGVDQVLGASGTVFTVQSLYEGSGSNGIQATVQATSSIGITTADAVNDPLAARFDLLIAAPVAPGSSIVSQVEQFHNLSMYSASPRYIVTVLTRGVTGEVGPSSYVSVNVVPTYTGPAVGTYLLAAGTDGLTGLTDSDYIGTVNGQTATGLQALRNTETTEFNLLAIPGVTSSAVIGAMIGLAQSRNDFDIILDTPFGLSCSPSDPNNVVNWHNGLATGIANAPTAPINSNRVLLYYPWVQVGDSYNGGTIWLPPCGDVLAAHAASDETVGPGWAVAGPVRGALDVLDIEYSASQADRDYLEGIDTTNRVNPIIVQFSGGAIIYGDWTCQRSRSALENAHTRRMLTYAEKVCATAVAKLQFNPNDPMTWTQFINLCNEPLKGLVTSRAIGSFKIICDKATNPVAQRQNKTLRGKLLIEAVESSNIILMDFSLYSTGANFNEAF